MFALAGFALLSCGDSVLKTMAGLWAPPAVAGLRYSFGALGLAVLLFWHEGWRGFAMPRPHLQLMRGGGIGIATAAFCTAIFIMPLADATAILFTAPMITSVLAILFLGEKPRRATWLATGLAFTGVLVVLRPNVIALGPAALLPLVSAAGTALLMIGNRAGGRDTSVLAQQFFAAGIAAPIIVVMALIGHFSGLPQFHIGIPPLTVVLRCAIVSVSATIGQWLVFRGTLLAGASTVTPMVYVQILVATVMGWFLFGATPKPMSMLGVAVIVVAGLILWRAGRSGSSPAAAERDGANEQVNAGQIAA